MGRPKPTNRERLARNVYLDRGHVEGDRLGRTETRQEALDRLAREHRKAIRRIWLGAIGTLTVLFGLMIGSIWCLAIVVDPRQPPGKSRLARMLVTLMMSGTVGYLMGRASRANKARRPSTHP